MPKTEQAIKKGAKQIRIALEKHRAGTWKIEKLMKTINKQGKECITLVHFSPKQNNMGLTCSTPAQPRRYETVQKQKRKLERGLKMIFNYIKKLIAWMHEWQDERNRDMEEWRESDPEGYYYFVMQQWQQK